MATFAKENLFLVLWLFSKEISYRWWKWKMPHSYPNPSPTSDQIIMSVWKQCYFQKQCSLCFAYFDNCEIINAKWNQNISFFDPKKFSNLMENFRSEIYSLWLQKRKFVNFLQSVFVPMWSVNVRVSVSVSVEWTFEFEKFVAFPSHSELIWVCVICRDENRITLIKTSWTCDAKSTNDIQHCILIKHWGLFRFSFVTLWQKFVIVLLQWQSTLI
jgi:hypothetical protein